VSSIWRRARILKPRGKAFYFYEPVTPAIFHPMAYWRVNKKRLSVPEDVLITTQILKIAKLKGLDANVDYHPTMIKRGAIETIYYWILNQLPFLQERLFCTADFFFTKNAS
jgi:hypothetical protein